LPVGMCAVEHGVELDHIGIVRCVLIAGAVEAKNKVSGHRAVPSKKEA
jgi:hypothetical protein